LRQIVALSRFYALKKIVPLFPGKKKHFGKRIENMKKQIIFVLTGWSYFRVFKIIKKYIASLSIRPTKNAL